MPGDAASMIRYILLTQCLQNDFFLNRNGALYLGDQASLRLLTAATQDRAVQGGSKLDIGLKDDRYKSGPLAWFFEAAIDSRRAEEQTGPPFYVVNIRDWHQPGPSYDLERRNYGSHCEAGTWGADYIDGFHQWLAPSGFHLDGRGKNCLEGGVRFAHVHADSVFDFRQRSRPDGSPIGKSYSSDLDNLLDIVIHGTDDHLQQLDQHLASGSDLADQRIEELSQEIQSHRTIPAQVYIAVIGAYSDIKVLTLVGGLLSRYDIPNIAISSTLTASPTTERHITGLDFADKVMHVEILDGVANLARYLGRDRLDAAPPNEEGSFSDFSLFQTFFKDKQAVLAYESEKLESYVALTERRARENYLWVQRSNRFLILAGMAFLTLSLVLAVATGLGLGDTSWTLPSVTGGIGLVQVLAVLFLRPAEDLNSNLMRFTTYRMILESHSLKMALARFHLTTPLTLREIDNGLHLETAKRQIELLNQELATLGNLDAFDHAALRALGFAASSQSFLADNKYSTATNSRDSEVDDATKSRTPTTSEKDRAHLSR